MMRGANVAANSAVCRVSGVSVDDRVDVFGEAHVEHLVGFIEHEHLDQAEIERAAAHVIEHAARRADDDFGAAPQRANLVIHRRAAIDGHDVQVRALRVFVQRLRHLHRELACRHEHERADLAAAALAVARELVEERQRERRGLAGAGGGLAEHVAAGDQDGNGFSLDRRGLFVAERGHGGDQRSRQSERGKTRPHRLRGLFIPPVTRYWVPAISEATRTPASGRRCRRRA